MHRCRLLPMLLAGASTLVPLQASAMTLEDVRTTRTDEIVGAGAPGILLWSQNSQQRPNHYNTYLKVGSDDQVRLNPPGTNGFGGDIDGDRVVYERVRRDADLWLRLADGTQQPIGRANTPKEESHPSLSGDFLLFTRGVRGRRTTVILLNIATGQPRILAQISGGGRPRYVYSGQVNGNYAVWGRVTPIRQTVHLYDISAGEGIFVPQPERVFAQYDPAVTAAGTVYYQRSGNFCGGPRIVREPLTGDSSVLGRLGRRDKLDGGYMNAYDNGDGTTSVIVGTIPCNGSDGDILKFED